MCCWGGKGNEQASKVVNLLISQTSPSLQGFFSFKTWFLPNQICCLALLPLHVCASLLCSQQCWSPPETTRTLPGRQLMARCPLLREPSPPSVCRCLLRPALWTGCSWLWLNSDEVIAGLRHVLPALPGLAGVEPTLYILGILHSSFYRCFRLWTGAFDVNPPCLRDMTVRYVIARLKTATNSCPASPSPGTEMLASGGVQRQEGILRARANTVWDSVPWTRFSHIQGSISVTGHEPFLNISSYFLS